MYNKKNLKKMFYDPSLGLPQSMEQPNYYRARIVHLYEFLKDKGIYPVTELKKIDSTQSGSS